MTYAKKLLRTGSTLLTLSLLAVASDGIAYDLTPITIPVIHLGTIQDVAVHSRDDVEVDVACDDLNEICLAVYEYHFLSDSDIIGQYLDRNGAPVGDYIRFTSTVEDQVDPAVSYDPVNDEFVVVWSRVNSGGNIDVRGRRLSGDTLLASFDIGATADDETHPDISCSSEGCLVVWSREVAVTDLDIYGRFMDAAGNLAGSSVVIVDELQSESMPQVHFMPLYLDYYVTWEHWTTSTNSDIRARFVGESQVGQVQIVADTSLSEELPDVSCHEGRSCLFVWQVEQSNGLHQIHGGFTQLDSSGYFDTFDDLVFTSGDGNIERPTIAKSSNLSGSYLVAWHEYHWSTTPLFHAWGSVSGNRVTLDGDLQYAFTAVSGNGWSTPIPSNPAVGMVDGGYVFAWQLYQNGSYDVLARRLTFGFIPYL